MGRHVVIAPLTLVFSYAAPAAAQTDPTGVGQTMVLAGQAQGYADRGNGRSTSRHDGLDVETRSYCDAAPRYRARYGANDKRVVRLMTACRRAGYRY